MTAQDHFKLEKSAKKIGKDHKNVNTRLGFGKNFKYTHPDALRRVAKATEEQQAAFMGWAQPVIEQKKLEQRKEWFERDFKQ